MNTLIRKLLAVVALGLGTSLAHAGGVHWSIGINLPPIGTVISNAPVYYPPVPYYEPPVVYRPAPVYYTPPPAVIYRPVPRYVAPPAYVVDRRGPVYRGGWAHRDPGGWRHDGRRGRDWGGRGH